MSTIGKVSSSPFTYLLLVLFSTCFASRRPAVLLLAVFVECQKTFLCIAFGTDLRCPIRMVFSIPLVTILVDHLVMAVFAERVEIGWLAFRPARIEV